MEGRAPESLPFHDYPQVIPPWRREDGLFHRREDSGTGWRPSSWPPVHIRMSVDSQNYAPVRGHQFGLQVIVAMVFPVPIQDQDQDHLLLDSREPGREEVMKNPLNVQLSVWGFMGLVTKKR